MKWLGKSPREETVPRSLYDTAIQERDTFKDEVTRLQEQMADLSRKLDARGHAETALLNIASEAITLLQQVDSRRTGGAALQKKIDEIVARARYLGLVREKAE